MPKIKFSQLDDIYIFHDYIKENEGILAFHEHLRQTTGLNTITELENHENGQALADRLIVILTETYGPAYKLEK